MADRVQKLRTEIVREDDPLNRAFLLDKFEAAIGQRTAHRISEYCRLEGLPPVAYGAADIAAGELRRLKHLRAVSRSGGEAS